MNPIKNQVVNSGTPEKNHEISSKQTSYGIYEMWKNTIESEGLPCKILPDGKSIDDWAENLNYVIYVPIGREHVADEIIRKI